MNFYLFIKFLVPVLNKNSKNCNLDLIELLEKLSDTGDKYSSHRSRSRDNSQSRARSPSLRRRTPSANTEIKQDYTQEQYEAVLKYEVFFID